MSASARKVIRFPKASAPRTDYELAFLPAALEITETPPSPVGRAVAGTIMAVFALSVLWAILGTVDIVATATGRIVPSGRTKVIQPFETGVVRAIHVRNGQRVAAGDVLIELDPTMTEADEAHLRSDLVSARLDAARLRAAIDGAEALEIPSDATPTQIAMHRHYLLTQKAELRGKLAEIDRQVAQKQAERGSVQASVDKLNAVIPVAEERLGLRKQLLGKELTSRLTYLSEYQEMVGMRQDLVVQQNRLRETEAAMATLQETRSRVESEVRRAWLDDLVKAEQKVASLTQDVIKADRRTQLQVLTAPVDGVVQQLDVHTIGGVVTPAQPLAIVVPADSRLEIEAMVSNQDIGFVRAGQPAEIKVDTFSFTRYGLLHGTVLDVSPDAVTADRPQGRDQDKSTAGAGASRQKDQGLNYAARVSLDRTQMQVENGLVNLGPGMSVTVEIKTGSRRIISYLLSPLVRYKQESLRER
ncbi:HlyD family type I secretion periplasmic adaptor subunit [uncultured Alsobacter sp.]|uniref:HlyD family type I secretion periplasmic adaptor subunit n=1 Tax=uncultured Alsobacter sp. TaxID=1748258 RepID=UPI0025FE4F07|nr:HlyD family type I secretion periplasmic adaptor subunit [uncultured Alsobacter sp.]